MYDLKINIEANKFECRTHDFLNSKIINKLYNQTNK